MTEDTKKSAEPPVPAEAFSDDEQPEIYGITNGKNGIALNRRSFLGALAAAGALAACPPALAAGKDEPAASSKTPVKSRAHHGKIEGLELRDTSLFSWDPGMLRAWTITKGSLDKTVLRSNVTDGLKQAGAIFPDLFQRIWDSTVLAFGPDGKTLAVRDKDGVALWQSAKGKPKKIKTLKANPGQVYALAIHPDGTKLAAGGTGGFLAVWDLKDGTEQRFDGNRNNLFALAFHPKEPLLLSGHRDGNVRQWNLSNGKAGKRFKWHNKPIRCLEVTPDGKLAVTAGEDTVIKLWSLPDGKEKVSINVPQGETTSAMDLSADGRLLATGTPQGRIYLWRLPEGEMMGTLFSPDLVDKGTLMGRYRQMSAQLQTQPCDKPLPQDATCVCDCVADNRLCGTALQVCTCDTIAVPAGYAVGGKTFCACNMVAVGTKAPASPAAPRPSRAPSGCGCVGNVSRGGSHYWRPN